MGSPFDEIPRNLHAFPYTVTMPDGRGGTYWQVCPGMTLRDWFAGQAVTGILAADDRFSDPGLAKAAYAIADAMLAARKVAPPEK